MTHVFIPFKNMQGFLTVNIISYFLSRSLTKNFVSANRVWQGYSFCLPFLSLQSFSIQKSLFLQYLETRTLKNWHWWAIPFMSEAVTSLTIVSEVVWRSKSPKISKILQCSLSNEWHQRHCSVNLLLVGFVPCVCQDSARSSLLPQFCPSVSL